MWPINNWYHGGGVKQVTLAQDRERQLIHYRESESKKLTANAAFAAHILSETTRDESTLTYADNGI